MNSLLNMQKIELTLMSHRCSVPNSHIHIITYRCQNYSKEQATSKFLTLPKMHLKKIFLMTNQSNSKTTQIMICFSHVLIGRHKSNKIKSKKISVIQRILVHMLLLSKAKEWVSSLISLDSQSNISKLIIHLHLMLTS